MTIYVGNISYSATRQDLEDLFSPLGRVLKITVPKDHEKGHMRGYAFIEMEDDMAEDASIEKLNNTEHMGRFLKIEKANSNRSARNSAV